MLSVQVVKQIAGVASSSNNFSSTTFAVKVVWSTSDFLNPESHQTAETAPLFGSSSWSPPVSRTPLSDLFILVSAQELVKRVPSETVPEHRSPRSDH